ncbi:hypothetical protein ACQJBY_062678 [Aegilops geniculata]
MQPGGLAEPLEAPQRQDLDPRAPACEHLHRRSCLEHIVLEVQHEVLQPRERGKEVNEPHGGNARLLPLAGGRRLEGLAEAQDREPGAAGGERAQRVVADVVDVAGVEDAGRDEPPEGGAGGGDGPELGGVEAVGGAGEAEVEVGEPGGGGRVRVERRHHVLRPAVELGEVERGELGAGPEQRLEIRAAGEVERPLVPAHELDGAQRGRPAGREAGECGGVAAVDGEAGDGGEVGGEARRHVGVPLRDLLRAEREVVGGGGGRRARDARGGGEQRVAPRRGEGEVEPLQRREAEGRREQEEVGRPRVPAQRHGRPRRPLRRQQPAAGHGGPVPGARVVEGAQDEQQQRLRQVQQRRRRRPRRLRHAQSRRLSPPLPPPRGLVAAGGGGFGRGWVREGTEAFSAHREVIYSTAPPRLSFSSPLCPFFFLPSPPSPVLSSYPLRISYSSSCLRHCFLSFSAFCRRKAPSFLARALSARQRGAAASDAPRAAGWPRRRPPRRPPRAAGGDGVVDGGGGGGAEGSEREPDGGEAAGDLPWRRRRGRWLGEVLGDWCNPVGSGEADAYCRASR